MMRACGSSVQGSDAHSFARTRSVEAMSRGKDARRTSDALDLLVVSSLARKRMRRGLPSARCVGDVTGERRGAMIRISCVSATPALSWRRPLAEARLQSRGGVTQVPSAHVERFVALVRQPMQKSELDIFSTCHAKSPNQAMQLTPTRCTIHFQ